MLMMMQGNVYLLNMLKWQVLLYMRVVLSNGGFVLLILIMVKVFILSMIMVVSFSTVLEILVLLFAPLCG